MMEKTLHERAHSMAQHMAGVSHSAIITRYYGATNTRGARIVARLAGEGKRPRVSIGYPYEAGETERHLMAALALLDNMRREGDAYAPAIVGGGAIVGGYAFILETAPAY